MTAPCPLPDVGPLIVDIPRWEYRTPHPLCPAYCRLQVWRSQSVGFLAVVTELPDNPGMSVTNAAENIQTALLATYPTVVTMEHYHGSRSMPSGSLALAERLSRVWLQGHLAQWEPVWPLAPSNPAFEAHAMWAQLYFEQVTGCTPDLPAPLL